MKFLVSPAPHRVARQSLTDLYVTISCCLFACLLVGYIYFGTNVLIIIASAVGSSVLFEFLCDLVKTKQVHAPHLSSLVTGLLIACVMPINAPWFFCIGAAAVAIFTKYLFGGLGNNMFNPAAVGRAVVGVLAVGFSYDFFGEEKTILASVLTGAKENLELAKMFTGEVAGAIGTTCIIIILIAAVVLICMHIIRWENIAFATLSFVAIIWACMGYENILPMMLGGSFMFVTVFMLSDPVSSPYTFSGRCLYSVVFGVVAAFMMAYNVMGESAVFLALIVANLLAPMFDAYISLFHRGVKKHD